MIVSGIELRHVKPRGESDRESVFVRLESGGVFGWGEATVESSPSATDQWAGCAFAFCQRWLAPCVLGAELSSADELAERMSGFRGQSLAKGAFACAWHDLDARRRGVSLGESLGASRTELRCYAAFGVRESIDALLAEINDALEHTAVGVSLHLRPGWGIEVVRAVRANFAAVPLRVDFDGTATMEQRDLIFRLQDYQIEAIEQPLDPDDLVGHAMLQEALRTPICLDQSITSPLRAKYALDVGACRQIRVRPDFSGGHRAAMSIAEACREAEASCTVGASSLTAVGMFHALTLARTADCDGTVEVECEPVGASMKALRNDDGTGVEPDLAALETIAKVEIRSGV